MLKELAMGGYKLDKKGYVNLQTIKTLETDQRCKRFENNYTYVEIVTIVSGEM